MGAAKRGPPPQRLEEERLGGGAPPVRGGAGEGPRRRERRRGRLRAFRGRQRGDRTRGRGLPRVAADRLVVRRVAAQRTRTIFDAARSRARNSRATGPGSTTSSTPSTPSRARPVPVRPTVDRASPPPRAYLASLVHMRLAGPVFGELVSAAGCQTRRILLRRPRSVALKGPGLRASLQRSGPDRAPFFFWAGDFYPSGREGCQPPVGFFGCLRPPATRRIFKVCFFGVEILARRSVSSNEGLTERIITCLLGTVHRSALRSACNGSRRVGTPRSVPSRFTSAHDGVIGFSGDMLITPSPASQSRRSIRASSSERGARERASARRRRPPRNCTERRLVAGVAVDRILRPAAAPPRAESQEAGVAPRQKFCAPEAYPSPVAAPSDSRRARPRVAVRPRSHGSVATPLALAHVAALPRSRHRRRARRRRSESEHAL